MNYCKLALVAALLLLLPCSCYATSVAGATDVEGAQNTVVLLNDPDGGIGQIVISTTGHGQSVVLNQPNQVLQVPSAFQPSPPVVFPPQTPQQVIPGFPANQPVGPVQPSSAPAATGQEQTTSPNGSQTTAGGLTTTQLLIGLSQGAGAIPQTVPPSVSGFLSAPLPAAQANQSNQPANNTNLPAAVPPIPAATSNHSTDQVLNTVAAQLSGPPELQSLTPATAQYFFEYGQDKNAETTFYDGTAFNQSPSFDSDSIAWGAWATPLQQGAFTQSTGMVYSSDCLSLPPSQANFSATYNGGIQGTVTAGGNVLTADSSIGMTVNFASHTLNFSGSSVLGSVSGSGSFHADSPTVTGQLSYTNTTPGTSSFTLNGSFHGAFFGNATDIAHANAAVPASVGAAWAVAGKVNGADATGTGVLVAFHNN